jgi:hypothetical protein
MEVTSMVAVQELSWEEVSSPDFGNPTKAAWRAAVADIAAKARVKLPECNGRVDKAVALVLNNDVALLADGSARVGSQSNGTTAYHVVNGHCDCRDWPKTNTRVTSRKLTRRDYDRHQCQIGFPIICGRNRHKINTQYLRHIVSKRLNTTWQVNKASTTSREKGGGSCHTIY